MFHSSYFEKQSLILRIKDSLFRTQVPLGIKHWEFQVNILELSCKQWHLQLRKETPFKQLQRARNDTVCALINS